MDYGKQAYIKVQELEGYLHVSEQRRQGEMSASAAAYPHTAAESAYSPFTLAGQGNVALSVSVRCRAETALEGKLWLRVGGKRAAYAVLALSAGQETSVTLYASVYPGDGEAIGLQCDKAGLLLEEVFVQASGTRVRLRQHSAQIGCDGSGENVFSARVVNGNVTVRRCGTATTAVAFKGGVFDIAVFGDEVYVIGCDDLSNVVGVTYSFDLEETSRQVLGQAPFDSLAIGRTGYGVLLAGVIDRRVYTCMCTERFSGRTDFVEFADLRADEVWLSKQAQASALVLRRDDDVFAKLPRQSQGARDTVAPTFALL